MSRAQRLTMEETIRVSEWIKANGEFVKKHQWNLEPVRQRIQSELGILTTSVAIERIAGWERPSNNLVPSGKRKTTLLQLVDAIEHLYDQLGEERHHSLAAIREAYSAAEDKPVV